MEIEIFARGCVAKALQTILPDFKPSPMQHAAIDRIQDFQEELKTYGFYVRSSVELEFMIQNQYGELVPSIIDLPKVHDFLRDDEGLPF